MAWNEARGPNWPSRSRLHQHIICREAQPDDEAEYAPIYASDGGAFQECREPSLCDRALFRALQLRPNLPEHSLHSSDGSSHFRSCVEHRGISQTFKLNQCTNSLSSYRKRMAVLAAALAFFPTPRTRTRSRCARSNR